MSWIAEVVVEQRLLLVNDSAQRIRTPADTDFMTHQLSRRNSPSIYALASVLFLNIQGCSQKEGLAAMGTAPGGASAIWPEEEKVEVEEAYFSLNPWLADTSSHAIEESDFVLKSPKPDFDQEAMKEEGNTSTGERNEAGSMEASSSDEEQTNDEEQTEVKKATPESGGEETTKGRASAASPTKLQLSEYFEGTGSDKSLTLVNWGEEEALQCVVEVYSNGGSQPWRSFTLPEVIAPGQKVVLCTEAMENPSCNHPMTASTYNGNDALVLRCRDEIIDSFGQLGVDPGDSWEDSGGVFSSKDTHLLRCRADDLDSDPSDVFVLETSWVPIEEGQSPEKTLSECVTEPTEPLGAGGAANP